VRDLRDQIASNRMKAEPAGPANRWLLAGGLSLGAMLGLVSWQLARRRKSRSLLPARVGTSNAVGTVIALSGVRRADFCPVGGERPRRTRRAVHSRNAPAPRSCRIWPAVGATSSFNGYFHNGPP